MKKSQEISNGSHPLHPLIGGIIFAVVWLVMSYLTEPDTFFQPDAFLLPIVGGICFGGVWYALENLTRKENQEKDRKSGG